MSKQHLEARRWLKSHKADYPHLAVSAPHEDSPGKLDCVARVTAFQCKTWAFRSEADRDFFVVNVETAEHAGRQ